MALRADYEARKSEVKDFIGLIAKLEPTVGTSGPDLEGFKGMKAATHLLIYNLVEAFATGVHEALFDGIAADALEFDVLTMEVKKTVWRNAQKPNPDKLLPKLTILSRDIMGESFSKAEVFSGNVDGLKIRDSFKALGMMVPTARSRQAKHGSDALRIIKDNRNDLAHGRKTFTEVGRDMTSHDLLDEFSAVVTYLDYCLTIAEKFMTDKLYKVV